MEKPKAQHTRKIEAAEAEKKKNLNAAKEQTKTKTISKQEKYTLLFFKDKSHAIAFYHLLRPIITWFLWFCLFVDRPA